jgi:SAM-dependent methyltransferase
MQAEDRRATEERYRARWRQYGYDSRTLGWNKDCQWVRFEAAFEGLRDDECASVLDVGCGFGDLLGYLRGRGWKGRYTGVDLVDELVAEARRQYADDAAAAFVCDDVERVTVSAKHDMVVAIGIFNHRLDGDHFGWIRTTVEKMWSAAARVVVCDFLSTSAEVERRQPNLYYADPRQVFELAADYSRRVMIHQAYMPFEFQVKIWRDDTFEVPSPVFRPYRHLASAQTEWRKQRQGFSRS